MELISVVILIVIGALAISHLVTQARRKQLMKKYGDSEVVEMIMKKMIWQGMTTEQLVDSLGHPVVTDKKAYKTKTSETYKYDQVSKNRFRRRITVENGVVVGWDIK